MPLGKSFPILESRFPHCKLWARAWGKSWTLQSLSQLHSSAGTLWNKSLSLSHITKMRTKTPSNLIGKLWMSSVRTCETFQGKPPINFNWSPSKFQHSIVVYKVWPEGKKKVWPGRWKGTKEMACSLSHKTTSQTGWMGPTRRPGLPCNQKTLDQHLTQGTRIRFRRQRCP